MESNFAQQMNEERISTKIGTLVDCSMKLCIGGGLMFGELVVGIMEDLEEERIQREEETKKKKLLKRTKTK